MTTIGDLKNVALKQSRLTAWKSYRRRTEKWLDGSAKMLLNTETGVTRYFSKHFQRSQCSWQARQASLQSIVFIYFLLFHVFQIVSVHPKLSVPFFSILGFAFSFCLFPCLRCLSFLLFYQPSTLFSCRNFSTPIVFTFRDSVHSVLFRCFLAGFSAFFAILACIFTIFRGLHGNSLQYQRMALSQIPWSCIRIMGLWYVCILPVFFTRPYSWRALRQFTLAWFYSSFHFSIAFVASRMTLSWWACRLSGEVSNLFSAAFSLL